MSTQLLSRLFYLLGLLGITAAVIWAIRSQRVQLAGTKQSLRQQSLEVANKLHRWRSLSMPARLGTLLRFFYLATLASILVLAFTGFLPVIVFGAAVSNIALMLHLVLAPFFAIGLTALVLFWAQRHRFNKNDWEHLQLALRKAKTAAAPAQLHVWQKICFWLSAVLALLVIGSTILMMYPLYGTTGQEWLLHLHGYAGLLLLAVVLVHTYLILRHKHD